MKAALAVVLLGLAVNAYARDESPADAAAPQAPSPVDELGSRLRSAAGDGSKGVTPDMAADITATLLQSQGSVSSDMRDLLDSVSRDGVNLTPDTMKLLQQGARDAKGQGLELGVAPEMEKLLLEHDFEADKPAFQAGQEAPSM
jgi:hypothetical protein